MSCYVLNDANEKESVLYPELLRVLGSEEAARETYDRIMGETFLGVFGDWVSNYKADKDSKSPSLIKRTYPNGEPELHQKKGTNQYYFLDDQGSPYFLDKRRFAELTTEEVDEVTRILVHDFVTNQREKTFNEMDPDDLKEGEIRASIRESVKSYKEDLEQIGNEEVKEEYTRRADLILKYEDDFRQEIISSIEALGKRFQEKILDEEGNPIDEVPENDKTTGLNIKESFEKNSKDTATVNTKLFLSMIEDRMYDEDTGETETIASNFLSKEKFVEFNEVWSTLQPLLSDIVGFGHGQNVVDVYDLMVMELQELQEVKPWMKSLLDKLEDLSPDKKTEFVQAFSNTKINFYVTEFDGKDYKVINATSTRSRESQIVNEWGFMFQETMLNGAVMTGEGRAKISNIQQSTNKIFNEYQDRLKSAKNDVDAQYEAIGIAASELLEQMDALGIFSLTLDDINTFILVNGGYENRFREMDRIFKAMKFVTKEMLKEDKIFSNGQEFENPFSTESTFKALAYATGLRSTEISESSILSNKGKSYFAYSKPTYINNKINQWTQDVENKADDDFSPSEVEVAAMETQNANSLWLKHLAALDVENPVERRKKSIDRLQSFKTGIASSFKSKGVNDGVDNKEIIFQDAVNDNITKILGGVLKGGKTYFPTIVPADKSRRIEFEGLPVFESGIDIGAQNLDLVIKPETIDLFVGYFTDEYNRMKKVKREIKELPENEKVVHYHTGAQNGLKSQIFPEFSPESTIEKFEALRDALYASDKTPLSDDSLMGLDEDQERLLREAIRDTLNDRINDTLNELNKIDNINSKIKKHYDMNYFDGATALAGDYLVNGIIAAVEYGKVFSGDPAYYKNMADLIKRIPATYTDGLQLRLKDSDQLIFNQATIANVEVPSTYIDKIEESVSNKSIVEDYRRVNTTDAQAWITPNRWKFLKQRLGQWSPLHKAAYNNMINGKRLSKAQRKVAAQPLKGVYFEINDGRPVYLKYSQAVLMPDLVKGTPMEAILNKMTIDSDGNPLSGKDEIHEVITIDGVKVGSMMPTEVHKAGTTEIKEHFELNPTQLSNRGWKLQVELPIKNMHETNLGSQIQKNILAGMVMDGEYEFDGKTISGRELMQEIHDTVSELSNLGKQNLIEKFGIVDDKITNKDALYSTLIDEFKARGGNDNIIQALEKEMPFDAIPQISDKVQSVFMSVINKEITKIATNGGSFVQVSPFGLETVNSRDESSIKIVSKNYDGKGLQPPRIVDGKVLPGQAFIPHSEAERLLFENGFDINEMTGDEIMEKLSPEALELVTYRIPNQGMSSNDALEIVGILPIGMGDSIIAYDGIPAKTGSDFDIDKMYVMMKNLWYNPETSKIEEVKGGKEGLQNKLVDLYKSVLTNPNTYDQMMKSIDGSFLRDDIVSLFEAKPKSNLELFSPIVQLKTKFEYLSGKFGVGQTANQLVDHVLNQQLQIGLTTYLGVGDYDIVGEKKMTSFDKNFNTDRPIIDTLSAFLNAYVDIAKDPYIARGNHNGVTANTAFMLVRAGVPITWVNRFIGQPVLVDLIELMSNIDGKTSEPLEIDGKRVKVEEYLRETQKIPHLEDNPRDLAAGFTEDQMENYIKEVQEGAPRDPLFDAEILAVFNFFKSQATNLADSVRASKADTVGAGGSFIHRTVRQNLKESVEGIRNFDTKFENTMLGTYHSNAVDWAGTVIDKSEIFMAGREAIHNTFNEISGNAGKGKLLTDLDFGRSLENAFYSYMLSGSSIFSENNERFDELVMDLPKNIVELKKNSENFFIQELELANFGRYTFMGINSKNKPTYYQNKIYRSWLALYDDASTRDVAIDLSRYAFVQSGFQNNMNQFYSHIPHEILKDSGISGEIKQMMNNIKDLEFDDNFIEQFFRHNADDTNVVGRISKGNVKSIGKTPIQHGFKYDIESENKSITVETTKDGTAKAIYPPFLSMKSGEATLLFKKMGVVKERTAEGNDVFSPIYSRTYKLGHSTNRGKVFEYNKDTKLKKSIVKENKIPQPIVKSINNFVADVRKMPNFVENEIMEKVEQQNEPFEVVQREETIEQNIAQPVRATGKKEFSYDGNTIQTEFVLGAEQVEALTEILDFITGKSKSPKNKVAYMLQGSAGTGKTTIIGYAEKMLKEISYSYGTVYMAPTHAATVQLAQTTVRTGNRQLPFTVQSSVITDRYGNPSFTFKTKKKMENYGRPVIIVDEASMLNGEDFNNLVKAAGNSDVKIIFMGDIAQIPAVIKNVKEKQVAKPFTELDRSVLNTVYRQDEGTLLTMLTKIRNNTEFISYEAEGDESVQFLDRDEFLNSLENDLNNSPDDTLMISYSNKAVAKSNQFARRMTGREGAPQVGEQIIGYGGYNNKQISRGQIANSVKYQIENIHIGEKTGIVTITAKSKVLEKLAEQGVAVPEDFATNYMQLSPYDQFDFGISPEMMEKNNKAISKIFRRMHQLNLEIAKLGKNFRAMAPLLREKEELKMQFATMDLGGEYIYNPSTDRMEKYNYSKHSRLKKEYVLSKGIDFGYAITIHKAQGMTIPNVYFDVGSVDVMRGDILIKDGKEVVTTEKNALYYVGLSRASNKVVMRKDYNFDEKLDLADEKKTAEEVLKKQTEQAVKSDKEQVILDLTDGFNPTQPSLSLDIIKKNFEQIKEDLNLKKDCE